MDYTIYEINANFSGWTRVSSFYVPTVLINGRGTRYEEAKSSNTAYCGTPKTLESLNMLNGRFKAYYTSDGVSSCFRLPFSTIANEAVNCRIYSAPNVYWEWTVPANATTVTARYFTADITMNLDRGKGIVYFTDSSNTDFPIINFLRYHENNICISATKSIENGFEQIVSSTCVASQGNTLFFSGGIHGKRVFCCHRENPFYFSELGSVSLGNDEPVVALGGFRDTILAWKENETYLIDIKAGKALNNSALLADNNAVFYDADSLTAKRVNQSVGCKNKNTVALCGSMPVWLGTNGAVYAYKSTTKELLEIY